jgi:hypothetical protein
MGQVRSDTVKDYWAADPAHQFCPPTTTTNTNTNTTTMSRNLAGAIWKA